MKAVPRGPENLVCPMHQKAMVKVCHTCPLWMSLRGKNPQTGEELDDWNCAMAWGPLLAVNAAREMAMLGAEMNAMRNETKKASDEHLTMAAIAVQRSTDAIDTAISRYASPSLTAAPTHLAAIAYRETGG